MDLSKIDDPNERWFWERFVLTGIHAFLFVDHVAGTRRRFDIIKELDAAVPEYSESQSTNDAKFSAVQVLSAAEFVGAFGAFVHLWAPPGQLAALQDFIGITLVDKGLRCNYATQATTHQGPDKTYAGKVKKCDVVAVVRIWVKRSAAGRVMGRLAELPGFQGAAAVFGDFDVLLVLDGEDFASVAKVVLGDLQEIKGIARTETAFADYRRNEDDYEPVGASV